MQNKKNKITMIITKVEGCGSYSGGTTSRGIRTDGGATGREALGTSMARDVRLGEGREPTEEG